MSERGWKVETKSKHRALRLPPRYLRDQVPCAERPGTAGGASRQVRGALRRLSAVERAVGWVSRRGVDRFRLRDERGDVDSRPYRADGAPGLVRGGPSRCIPRVARLSGRARGRAAGRRGTGAARLVAGGHGEPRGEHRREFAHRCDVIGMLVLLLRFGIDAGRRAYRSHPGVCCVDKCSPGFVDPVDARLEDRHH